MKKLVKSSIILAAFLVLSCAYSKGDEFCVQTAAELQNALTEAASNGEDDVIKVVRGTYIGNFIFDSYEGKSLVLLGGYSPGCQDRTLDPADTTLDGNNLGRVLFLNNSSGGDIYVEGFRIRKGFTTLAGGGIYASSQSWGMAGNITITDNILLDNKATGGGGIYALTSNEHVDEVQSSDRLTNRSSPFPFEDRLNSDPFLMENGSEGDIVISNNDIKNNTGGGIYVAAGGEFVGGFITIDNNLITMNTGRGITAYGQMMIASNFISNNNSFSTGGGIWARSSVYLGMGGYLALVNNIITENFAFNGGGVHTVTTGDAAAGPLYLINNTITENTCSNSGGGAYIDGYLDSALNIYNNIIWGNSSPVGGDITLLYKPSLGAESFGFNNNYSFISGNWTQSGQNINADPRFKDPSSDDYHLRSTSPCIDKGSNQAPALPDKDFDGEPRIFDGNQDNTTRVDIGADEYIGVPLQTLTIESSSGGSTNPAPGQYVFAQGTDVQITAVPEDYYRFHEWTGDVPAGKKQDNPLTITMGADKSIKAHFVRIIYPPSQVTGQKVMNRSLSQVEYINVLKWSANMNNQDLTISKYRIYVVDGNSQTLLVELSANIFEYWHRGVAKEGMYQYAISSVDDNNRESEPTNIIVQ